MRTTQAVPEEAAHQCAPVGQPAAAEAWLSRSITWSAPTDFPSFERQGERVRLLDLDPVGEPAACGQDAGYFDELRGEVDRCHPATAFGCEMLCRATSQRPSRARPFWPRGEREASC